MLTFMPCSIIIAVFIDAAKDAFASSFNFNHSRSIPGPAAVLPGAIIATGEYCLDGKDPPRTVPVVPLSPFLYPGMLPATIPWISGAYFFANFDGITASPGASIAGTVSLLPLPGTLTIPFANFLGALGGNIMPGLFIANFCPAVAADW